MTRCEALQYARRHLENAGMEDSTLEAELLLRQTLDIDLAGIYSYPETKLSAEHRNILDSLLMRRIRGEPSAYIRGKREFYGLDFIVDDRVLIPRPETELLVQETLYLAQQYEVPVIADIGIGSGAIAICLALKLPHARIYGVDISSEALHVAATNCTKHNVADRIKLLKGDFLEPLPEAPDIVVSNPPYVPSSDSEKLHGEPRLALDGGQDGLDTIKTLINQAKEKLKAGTFMLLEIGRGQDIEITHLLEQVFPNSEIGIKQDLSGIFRVVILRII